VQMAVVVDPQRLRRERRFEQGADAGDAIAHRGKALTNG
jgi:hypothetical protein